MTNTLGFKNSAFLCCQFSCKYLGLQYLSNKARKDQILGYSYSYSLRKYGLKGRVFVAERTCYVCSFISCQWKK